MSNARGEISRAFLFSSYEIAYRSNLLSVTHNADKVIHKESPRDLQGFFIRRSAPLSPPKLEEKNLFTSKNELYTRLLTPSFVPGVAPGLYLAPGLINLKPSLFWKLPRAKKRRRRRPSSGLESSGFSFGPFSLRPGPFKR